MLVKFYKYQGTGNDFIMIDNRSKTFKNNTKTIQWLCDRRFGVGADGLILLEQAEDPTDDFKMVYFNADGNESTMCGNGGRCLVKFASFLGIIKEKARFTAIDGKHIAQIHDNLVSLCMQDVEEINTLDNAFFLNTGSPHHVVFTSQVNLLDIKEKGAEIRNSNVYKKEGTNVNFVETFPKFLQVRTYERGVEDETLSCGTGVTAVAVAAHFSGKVNQHEVAIETLGGSLSVAFTPSSNNKYTNIWLTGPAEQVFEGEISC